MAMQLSDGLWVISIVMRGVQFTVTGSSREGVEAAFEEEVNSWDFA